MPKTNWGAETTTFEVDPGVSKFNSAQLTNQRLHNHFMAAATRWNGGRFDELNNVLDLIWVELFADADEKQRKFIEKVDDKIMEYHNKMMVSKKRKEFLTNNNLYAREIYKKFLFLKTVEKVQGMGKAYRDELEDDF